MFVTSWLDRQPFPAALAATGYDGATAPGSHSGPEPVDARSAPLLGLVRSLGHRIVGLSERENEFHAYRTRVVCEEPRGSFLSHIAARQLRKDTSGQPQLHVWATSPRRKFCPRFVERLRFF